MIKIIHDLKEEQMGILTEKEKRLIISCSLYWNEVAKRENPDDILNSELMGVVKSLGIKILWILEAYAKKEET